MTEEEKNTQRVYEGMRSAQEAAVAQNEAKAEKESPKQE